MIGLSIACGYLVFIPLGIKIISYLLEAWKQKKLRAEYVTIHENGEEEYVVIPEKSGEMLAVYLIGLNILLSILMLPKAIVDPIIDFTLAPLPPNSTGSLIVIRANNLVALYLSSVWVVQFFYIIPLGRYLYLRRKWEKFIQTILAAVITTSIALPPFALSIYNLVTISR
jgi:hypothetical protein